MEHSQESQRTTGLVLDEQFADHQTPDGHPERADRMHSLLQAFPGSQLLSKCRAVKPSRAREEWIRAVHGAQHWQRVRDSAGRSSTQLDADTFTSSDSFQIALLAAGSLIRLVDLSLRGQIGQGWALVRPPGHHAESNRIMGFCLFNNVAVAARYALQHHGLERVAIVDFDVHHGNGTQEIFYADPEVLYLSTHQSPWYPGTGGFSELGAGKGRGYTVNFPIRAGIGDFFYYSLLREFIQPILQSYRPEMILVSAGFDAHRNDPLGGMQLDREGFASLVYLLNQTARQECGGRILYVLEGGYHLEALADSVVASLATTIQPLAVDHEPDQQGEFSRYQTQTRENLTPFWDL